MYTFWPKNQANLNEFKKIKVLLTPPGCKEVIYEPGESNQFYFDKRFVDISIGRAPERIKNLANNWQGQRKQYGLKHHIAGTINSAMGDTLAAVATYISLNDRNYTLWGKVQLLVIISRTRLAKDTIFVGDKEAILDVLVALFQCRTQWTNYMEKY